MKQLIYFLLLSAALPCAPLAAQSMDRHVVSINVITQKFDYGSPWQKGEIVRSTIGGCVIEGNRIVTVSYSLANHVLVEVMKKGEARKYPAEVVVKDYHTGLAVLKVADPDFFKDLAPVAFSREGRIIGRTGSVYRWDANISLKEYAVGLNKTSIRFYEPNCGVLMHQFSTVMNEGGNGDPVFIDGTLVGIATGLSTENKTLFAISADLVDRLQKDLANGQYEGMPFFWIDTVDIGNDANLRKYLGMTDAESGVLVTEVPSVSSGSGILRKNDVILSINGTAIDDSGMYESPRHGRLYFYGLIQIDKFVGDEIAMNVLRDKKRTEVRFKLKAIPPDCCVIPLISYDLQPRYFVYGGLVFQELTMGYFESWGNEWKQKGDKRLLAMYDGIKSIASEGAVNRIVILNRVLPDTVNQGYQFQGNLVLRKVNGVAIKDIGHMRSVIAASNARYVMLEFAGDVSIVLDRQAAADGEKELLRKYNINAPYNTTGE